MSPLKTRGFTLIEILVALVLMGIVSVAIYQTLVTHQRTFLAQTQRIDLQQNIRAAATILPGEFRTLDAADSDIAVMSATAITIRAVRKLGFICNPPALGGGIGNISFVVRAQPYFGTPGGFVNNDSVLVYYEGNMKSRLDDGWVRAQLKSAPAAATCPDSVTTHPGWTLTIAPQWLTQQVNTPGAITNGSPVIGFQTVTYGLYATGGSYYVGDSVSGQGGWQPLIGPLTGSNGLTLSYYDSTGAATAARTLVAQIGIVLRAQTAVPTRPASSGTSAYQVDSVSTRVALRNNPRW
jgi:prepilin-type N-terminal cleavage/methylation domain-containing protein